MDIIECAEKQDKAERWESIRDLRWAMLRVREILLKDKIPLGYWFVSKKEYDIIVEFMGKPKLFGFGVYYE